MNIDYQKAVYGTQIDYPFIEALERGPTGSGLKGVVPSENSGATFGAGVDIGTRSLDELYRLGLPQSLIKKLQPFVGIRGARARQALTDKPTLLSTRELIVLEEAVKRSMLERLLVEYNGGGSEFRHLIPEAQTITASLHYQYGSLSKVPRFTAFVKKKEWQRVLHELRNFKDAFPTRRKKEADYLERGLSKYA